MKRLSLSLVCLLAACGGGSSDGANATAAASGSSGDEHAAPAFSMISVADVAADLGAPTRRLAVFDANRRETFEEHHVPGATWVHYDGVTAEVLPADHATQLVFYCANSHCGASHTAAEAAVALGYSNVSVMGEGIAGWVEAGQPVETGAPATATP